MSLNILITDYCLFFLALFLPLEVSGIVENLSDFTVFQNKD